MPTRHTVCKQPRVIHTDAAVRGTAAFYVRCRTLWQFADTVPLDSSIGFRPEANRTVERHRVSELPQSSTSYVKGGSATYSGIGVYDPGLFADCVPGRHPLKPLLDEAVARASLSGELYEGVWEDVGTPERLTALNQRFPPGSAN